MPFDVTKLSISNRYSKTVLFVAAPVNQCFIEQIYIISINEQFLKRFPRNLYLVYLIFSQQKISEQLTQSYV